MKSTLLLGILMAASSFSATIHDFTLKSIDGKDMPLSAYKGKAVLIVNTASQ